MRPGYLRNAPHHLDGYLGDSSRRPGYLQDREMYLVANNVKVKGKAMQYINRDQLGWSQTTSNTAYTPITQTAPNPIIKPNPIINWNVEPAVIQPTVKEVEKEAPTVELKPGAVVYSKATGKGHYVLVMPMQTAINVVRLQLSNKIEVGMSKSKELKQYQVDGWVALDNRGNPCELLAADLTVMEPSKPTFTQSMYAWIAFWPIFITLLMSAVMRFIG